jgi:glycosyltransferase involved in cell wall biosynthesis
LKLAVEMTPVDIAGFEDSVNQEYFSKFDQRLAGISEQLAELATAMEHGRHAQIATASAIRLRAYNDLGAWIVRRRNLLALLASSPAARLQSLAEQAAVLGIAEHIKGSFANWLCRRRTLIGLLRRSPTRGKIIFLQSLQIFDDTRVAGLSAFPQNGNNFSITIEKPAAPPLKTFCAPPGVSIPKNYQQRLTELLNGEELKRSFIAMHAIEPNIGELSDIRDFVLPSLSQGDGIPAAHTEVRRRLPLTHYDSIICVPWIRTGGADLVAGLLASALLRVRPTERVLVLRTDNPHFERADWLPVEADCVDISDLVKCLDREVAQNLLRLIFRGLTAKRVFNVNSLLCWRAMQTYGANLKATLFNYAYLFCWDLTPSGRRVGYPSEFFATTAANITAFLTDTFYLRNELISMYQLPRETSDRIVALHTPAQTRTRLPSIARIVHQRAAPGSRQLVLWAGRLDRQKRFDLVQEIARRMPEIEFRCWGSTLLDEMPDLTKLPENVSMQGNFAAFDDLPLADAGAWLFTSLWEGMPTTLIELATRGMPVVASAVGGVPELINSDTGWLLPAEAKPEDYVAALRQALASPEEAMRRAEALQNLVASKYTAEVFDAALEGLLEKEGNL